MFHKKSIMMKKFLYTAILLVSSKTLSAQNMFGNFASDIKTEVESYFPIIVGIVFIVSALFNLGKFFGEDRDIKKGVTNIVIFVGGTLLVMGAYKFLSGQSL